MLVLNLNNSDNTIYITTKAGEEIKITYLGWDERGNKRLGFDADKSITIMRGRALKKCEK